jgi:hypothetical protein
VVGRDRQVAEPASVLTAARLTTSLPRQRYLHGRAALLTNQGALL